MKWDPILVHLCRPMGVVHGAEVVSPLGKSAEPRLDGWAPIVVHRVSRRPPRHGTVVVHPVSIARETVTVDRWMPILAIPSTT